MSITESTKPAIQGCFLGADDASDDSSASILKKYVPRMKLITGKAMPRHKNSGGIRLTRSSTSFSRAVSGARFSSLESLIETRTGTCPPAELSSGFCVPDASRFTSCAVYFCLFFFESSLRFFCELKSLGSPSAEPKSELNFNRFERSLEFL